MRSWLRPQSGMRFYIDFDEKGAAFRRPKGVIHRPHTLKLLVFSRLFAGYPRQRPAGARVPPLPAALVEKHSALLLA